MTEELKPCPFCGCEMQFNSNCDWHRVEGLHLPDCVFSDVEDAVMTVPATKDGKAWATAAWNRRYAPSVDAAAPAIQQEGAALDERVVFEKVAAILGYSLPNADEAFNGMYHCSERTERAWKLWQARAALAAPAQPAPASSTDDPSVIASVQAKLKAAGCKPVAPVADAVAQSGIDRAAFTQKILLSVAEIPDRDSPEDQPEMMLVTSEELSGIIASAFESVDDAAPVEAKPDCRMQGGICACRSGGSYGGCAIERQATGRPLFANDAQPSPAQGDHE